MPEIVYYLQPVMAALENRLKEPENLAVFDGIIQEFQSNADNVYVRRGRAKVQDKYPCIGIEVVNRAEPWGAINYTKDVTVNVDVYGMLKVTGGQASDKISLAVEDYISKFGDALHGILNERNKLQYHNIDGQGMTIYDSYAEQADYTWLYQGAVRAVKLRWFGRLWLFGAPPQGTFSS